MEVIYFFQCLRLLYSLQLIIIEIKFEEAYFLKYFLGIQSEWTKMKKYK